MEREVLLSLTESPGAALLDGWSDAGRWTIAVRPKEAILELKPFGKLSRTDRNALFEEGEKLVRFYVPDAKAHGVRG